LACVAFAGDEPQGNANRRFGLAHPRVLGLENC
jgi:hypothetical protein